MLEEKKYNEVMEKIGSLDSTLCTVYGGAEAQDIGVAIDIFNNGGIPCFWNLINKAQWYEFCQKTKGTGLVMVEMLPPTWETPDRIKVLWMTNKHIKMAQSMVEVANKNFSYERKIKDLEYKFFSCVGKDEYDRILFHQVFNCMDRHDDFLLYNPDSQKHLIPEAQDKWGLNDIIEPTKEKRIEPYYQSSRYQDNWWSISSEIKRSEFEIMLTNWLFHEPNTLSHVDLLNMAVGVPTYRVYSKGLRELFSYWGFKSPYGTQGEDLLNETISWVNTYKTLPELVRQKMQDNHGPISNHNKTIFEKWDEVLYEHFIENWRKIEG